MDLDNEQALSLFSNYLKITGVAHTDSEKEGDSAFIGKRLGLVNGSSWITLWANFFGRKILPGVHLVNAGSEAVQINFMEAYQRHEPIPPQPNIDAFVRYAVELVELGSVDAILITCSTMNRSFSAVQQAVDRYNVPVIQIDRPMMERAVQHGGKALVVATHGPTVKSTQALLQETAKALNKPVNFSGLTNEEAWDRLAVGDVEGHNRILAEAIKKKLEQESDITCVVLAQLSMTVFLLSYPNAVETFGVPVFTSGQCGMEYIRDIFLKK